MLRAVAFHIRLDMVRVLFPIDQVLGIIRLWRIDRVLAFAASLPRAQRRIVIEAKVFNFAIEQFGQHCQLFSEQNTEASARDECLDPFHVGIAWSWPISLDHGVNKHFAELPESNPAFHFDWN